MNYDYSEAPRRGSRSRALERSLSYSEAIGSISGRSSIEIPSMVHTDVYTNEELKKHYRISQTYVEGKEITFPSGVTNVDKNYLTVPVIEDSSQESSRYSSEDEQIDEGLIMTIDVEDNTKSSDDSKHISDATTQPIASSSNTNDHIYDRIEVLNTDDSTNEFEDRETYSSPPAYGTPYSRRKRRSTHRYGTQTLCLG